MLKPLTITETRLRQLSDEAATWPRRRLNLNLHPRLDDSIQRLYNAMEPGTYVRPHRHARDQGWELMLRIRGAFAILLFDDLGTVVERVELNAGAGAAAVEIPAYAWHALVVLEPGTLMFEVKPGPYSVVDDKDFAAWAPAEDAATTGDFVAWYAQAQPGAVPPRPAGQVSP